MQPRARRVILCSEPRAGQGGSRPSGESGRILNREKRKSQRGTPQLPLVPGRRLRTCAPSNILGRGRHQKPVRPGQVCLAAPAESPLREPKKGQSKKVFSNVGTPPQPPFATKVPKSDKPKEADRPRRPHKKTPKGKGSRARARNIFKSQRGPPYKVDGANRRSRHSRGRPPPLLQVELGEPVPVKGQRRPFWDFATVPPGYAVLLVHCTAGMAKTAMSC